MEIKIKCNKCNHEMKVKFKEDWKQKYEWLKKDYDNIKAKLTTLETLNKKSDKNEMPDFFKDILK